MFTEKALTPRAPEPAGPAPEFPGFTVPGPRTAGVWATETGKHGPGRAVSGTGVRPSTSCLPVASPSPRPRAVCAFTGTWCSQTGDLLPEEAGWPLC